MLRFALLATLAICSALCASSNFIEIQRSDGNSPDINSVAYLVSIQYKKNNISAYEHRCSGTIYSSKVILTTATCLMSLELVRLHVKAGSPYRTKTHGYLYVVEKYIVHPDYDILVTDNDVALLILGLDLTDVVPKSIASITLMNTIPITGSLAVKYGWGRTGAGLNGGFSEIFQTADVNIVSNSDCQRSYGEFRISQAMLCTTSRTNACSGGSGGVLVYNNQAIGLKSWGFECGNSILPDVYTNLVYFREWIEDVVTKL